MMHMTDCHRAFLARALENDAIVFFLSPDVALSNGSLMTLLDRFDQGQHCILYPALRYSEELVTPELERRRAAGSSGELCISSRDLASIAVRARHSWMKTFDVESDHFSDQPILINFVREDGSFAVMNTSWGIGALDCRLIDDKALNELTTDTIDSHFIDRILFHNVGSSQITLLTESDDFLMVPVTTEAEMDLADHLQPKIAYTSLEPDIKVAAKKSVIKSALNGAWSDEFKRWAVRQPVYVHHHDASDKSDAEFLQRCSRFIDNSLDAHAFERPVHILIEATQKRWNALFWRETVFSLSMPGNIPSLDPSKAHKLTIELYEDLSPDMIMREWLPRFIGSFCEINFVTDASGYLQSEEGGGDGETMYIRLTAGQILSNGALPYLERSLALGAESVTIPLFFVCAYEWFQNTRSMSRGFLCSIPVNEIENFFMQHCIAEQKRSRWDAKDFKLSDLGVYFDHGNFADFWGGKLKTIACLGKWNSRDLVRATMVNDSREMFSIILDRRPSEDWFPQVRSYNRAPQWVIDDIQSEALMRACGEFRNFNELLAQPFVIGASLNDKNVAESISIDRGRLERPIQDGFDECANARRWLSERREVQGIGLIKFFSPEVGPTFFERLQHMFVAPCRRAVQIIIRLSIPLNGPSINESRASYLARIFFFIINEPTAFLQRIQFGLRGRK